MSRNIKLHNTTGFRAMHLFVCVCMFCIFSSSAYSQHKPRKDSLATTVKESLPPSTADKNVYKDSNYFSNIPVEKSNSKIDTAAIHQGFLQMDKKYQSNEFNYDDNRVNRLSWWDRLKRNIRDFLISLAPHLRFNLKQIFYYILIGTGLLVFAYVIYRLVINGKKPLYKEDFSKANAPDWIEDNLMDINLNTHLEQALSDKDYRLAIRYLHLINLKTLVQSGQIEWDVQKTNHDFMYEIKNVDLQHHFSTTIVVYEHIWYGGFHISEKQYPEYRQIFIDFKAQIPQKQTVIIA